MKSLKTLIPVALLTLSGAASATVIVTTEFNTADGFITGDFDDLTIQNLVTFSGGQQQQSFLGAAYNAGPAAYLFINGGGGFNGAASTGDTGSINFLGGGATTVSFHAANLGQGAATTFTSFDALGNTLETFSTLVASLNGTGGADEILTFNAVGGVNIASIGVDLPGPAANPPYAAAIDTFSATVVPEPSSALLAVLALVIPAVRRRR